MVYFQKTKPKFFKKLKKKAKMGMDLVQKEKGNRKTFVKGFAYPVNKLDDRGEYLDAQA